MIFFKKVKLNIRIKKNFLFGKVVKIKNLLNKADKFVGFIKVILKKENFYPLNSLT